MIVEKHYGILMLFRLKQTIMTTTILLNDKFFVLAMVDMEHKLIILLKNMVNMAILILLQLKLMLGTPAGLMFICLQERH